MISEKNSWKATFWAGGEKCIQTEKMLHLPAGRSRSLGQQSGKTATDGWSLDQKHQKTIGAGKAAYWLAPAVQGNRGNNNKVGLHVKVTD